MGSASRLVNRRREAGGGWGDHEDGTARHRELLYPGATSIVPGAILQGEVTGPWLTRMLDEKPVKVASVALATGTARIIWAVTVKGGSCRARGETKAVSAARRVASETGRDTEVSARSETRRRREGRSSGLDGSTTRMGVSRDGPDWRV